MWMSDKDKPKLTPSMDDERFELYMKFGESYASHRKNSSSNECAVPYSDYIELMKDKPTSDGQCKVDEIVMSEVELPQVDMRKRLQKSYAWKPLRPVWSEDGKDVVMFTV